VNLSDLLSVIISSLVYVVVTVVVWLFQPGLVEDGRSAGGRRHRPRSDNGSASHDSPYFFLPPQRHWRAAQCNESLHSNRGDQSSDQTTVCRSAVNSFHCRAF